MFFSLSKLLFLGFLQFKGNFVRGQMTQNSVPVSINRSRLRVKKNNTSFSTYKKQHFALQDHCGVSRRRNLRPVGGYGEAPFDTPFGLGRLVILKATTTNASNKQTNNQKKKKTVKEIAVSVYTTQQKMNGRSKEEEF